MDISFGALFASLVVSSAGFGFFLYGKRQSRLPQICVGLVMMGFPYFVTDPIVIAGVGSALFLALMGALRQGM